MQLCFKQLYILFSFLSSQTFLFASKKRACGSKHISMGSLFNSTSLFQREERNAPVSPLGTRLEWKERKLMHTCHFLTLCSLIGSGDVLPQLNDTQRGNQLHCGLIHGHESAGASQINAQNCRPTEIDERVAQVMF